MPTLPISHLRTDAGPTRAALRRLVLDELVGSGRPWPTGPAIDDAAMLAGSLGERVLDAIAAGLVRCRAGRVTFDLHEPARWHRLVQVDAHGVARLSPRRALQIAEYARIRRLAADASVRATVGGIDLAVDLPGGRRWAIVVTEAGLTGMREHLRDLRSEGVAILWPADREGLRPTARTAAVLHDGSFDHFSLVGHGIRFDFRVRRRVGCVQFERDVPPR